MEMVDVSMMLSMVGWCMDENGKCLEAKSGNKQLIEETDDFKEWEGTRQSRKKTALVVNQCLMCQKPDCFP